MNWDCCSFFPQMNHLQLHHCYSAHWVIEIIWPTFLLFTVLEFVENESNYWLFSFRSYILFVFYQESKHKYNGPQYRLFTLRNFFCRQLMPPSIKNEFAAKQNESTDYVLVGCDSKMDLRFVMKVLHCKEKQWYMQIIKCNYILMHS